MISLKSKITACHYGKFSLFFAVLFFVPSFVYFLIISFKNFLYKINILKETKTSPFVICVGNLTTGGVGKTPLVIEIANYLTKKGKKVAVLSRGYKGSLDSKKVNLVRTFDKILIDNPKATGDEVNLISKQTNAAVITCSNRVKGANYAKNELQADIVLMDDGFSNRKIFKNLNIVLIDTEKFFGNGFCLPYGPLREPVFEIKRADKVVFINKNNKFNPKLNKFVSKLKVKTEFCKMENKEITNIKTGAKLEENTDIIAFTGIGQPEQFYAKLKNFNLKETVSFNDHFKYDDTTIDKINKLMIKTGAKAIVTTEKDKVKIQNLKNTDNIYAMKLSVEINLDELFEDVNFN